MPKRLEVDRQDAIRQAVIDDGGVSRAPDLAERLGVHQSTIYYIRKQQGIKGVGAGRRSPKPKTASAPKPTALAAAKSHAAAALPEPKADEAGNVAFIRIEVPIDRNRAEALFGEFTLEDQALGIAAVIRKHIEAAQ